MPATAIQTGRFLLNGNNGSANYNYYVITSTNLAVPRSQGPRIAINYFDTAGPFFVTNRFSPGAALHVYQLHLPRCALANGQRSVYAD